MVYNDRRMVKNVHELNLSGTKKIFHLKQSLLFVGFTGHGQMFLVLI